MSSEVDTYATAKITAHVIAYQAPDVAGTARVVVETFVHPRDLQARLNELAHAWGFEFDTEANLTPTQAVEVFGDQVASIRLATVTIDWVCTGPTVVTS